MNFIDDHPDIVAARANADLRRRGVADRIVAIVTAATHARAHQQAVGLVDAGLDAAQAVAILAAIPAPISQADFEARVNEGGWFGDGPTTMENLRGDRTAQGWSKAIATANSRFDRFDPSATPTTPAGLTDGDTHEPNA